MENTDDVQEKKKIIYDLKHKKKKPKKRKEKKEKEIEIKYNVEDY